MKNGFRQQPLPSKKEFIQRAQVELQNLQTAGRISQMMIQQLLQNNKAMSADLGKALNLINELQYKILAVQKTANLDADALNQIADELRLNDFVEASDKEDAKEGFMIIDTVETDSTVILTSTVNNDSSPGIFRSRIELASCGVPELIQGLQGKPIGTKVNVKLNDIDHTIELLGVRRPKVVIVPAPEQSPELTAAPIAEQPQAQV